MGKRSVLVKRIYEEPSKQDGYRILVDRIWPRGLAKDTAAIDLWLKDVAPSSRLRKWFGHRPERWAEFKSRYHEELRGEAAAAALTALRGVKKPTITLLFAAKDQEHNNAIALQEYLAKGD